MSKYAASASRFVPDVLFAPFSTIAVGLVAFIYLIERLFFRRKGAGRHGEPVRHYLDVRRRKLSVTSENWARGLWPSALNAPTPAIQSILFFQPENTPSEQELASAIYHGCVKNHSRMRSLLVEVNEELPEGPLWKLLRMIGLAGPKIESRMVFEERDDYLLPEDVSNAQLKDKDAGCSERSSSSATLLGDEATQAKGGPRGPDLIRSKHIKVIPISSEADIWKDIEKTMEVDFFDTSKALWEVRLYRNSDPAAGRNAVVYLISHIMGDGISLMKLATGFFQAAGTGEHLEYVSPPRPQPRLLSFADRVKFWLWDTWKMMKSTVHVTGFLFFEDTKTEVKVGWYPRYTHTARRCVRVFEPLELDAINKIREAAKGKMHLDRKPTINDVMHSLFAGTVAEYLRERGDWAFLDALEKKKRGGKGPLIRIWTPYMFLHPDFASDPFNDLHNYWSMSSTPLPVAAPTALARLAESQKINRELLISGHDARATANTQKLVSQSLGWEIQGIFNLRATTAHTFTWSNVPGFFKGKIAIWNPDGKGPERVVDDALFVLGTPTPYFTTHSYAGHLNIVFSYDPELIKDVDRFAAIFREQFDQLAEEAEVKID